MPATEIRLAGSERDVIVAESVEQVEKLLSDAARSGQSRLAWLRELPDSQPIAINPTYVISLRAAPSGGEGPG